MSSTEPLFITVKTWQQPRRPSAGEWLNKLLGTDKGTVLRDKKKGATKQ